jgi:hypothetical protein
MGILRQTKYASATTVMPARAEGWAMQSFVQCWLATGDDRLKNAAIHRLRNLIHPSRRVDHPSRALVFLETHSATWYPAPHEFFMPWQQAPVAFGYLAAARFFQDPLFAAVAYDTVAAVAYSWVKDYQDPKFGLVRSGLRYYTPVSYNHQPVPADFWDQTPGIGARWGDSPLGGAHAFLIGAMDLIREQSPDVLQRAAAAAIREELHEPLRRGGDGWRWYKWANLREPR